MTWEGRSHIRSYRYENQPDNPGKRQAWHNLLFSEIRHYY